MIRADIENIVLPSAPFVHEVVGLSVLYEFVSLMLHERKIIKIKSFFLLVDETVNIQFMTNGDRSIIFSLSFRGETAARHPSEEKTSLQ